jgi:K+ transport systems, NAD-binding component
MTANPGKDANPQLRDHIVIVGYGMTGKSVARAAEILGIPYAIVEMDPDVTKRERESGSGGTIVFGDAAQREVLEHAGITQARALVVVISEQTSVPAIVHLAREMAPKIHIVVRTRHVGDARHLLDLGADEVIPEEFETSVRIFSCILAKYGLPKDDIRALTGLVRKNGYRIFRKGDTATAGEAADPEKLFGDLRISQVTVPEGSPAAGRTLRELDTWNRHSVAILAVRRGKETLTAPSPDLVVSPGDVLLLYGSKTGFEAVTGNTVGRGSPSPAPV